MTKSWATFGLDLHLDRDRSRVRAGLEQALRDAVQNRQLPVGTRLPSSRSLALDLGVARNTVAEAYAQLVAEGWLSARQGSGTVVAPTRRAMPSTSDVVTEPLVRPARYNLNPGSPDLAGFPRSAWLASTRRAVMEAPNEAFGYGDPRGRIELREALAGYLARVRRVRTSPDRIVVCSGFTQGLGLVAAALARAGSRTWVSEPYGLPVQTEIAAAHGFGVHALRADENGAVLAGLPTGSPAGRRPLLLLSPAHQFPLGMALTAARRRAAVEWAEGSDGVIVEDDYDGEFRYDRQPIGALQALSPGRVVYVGTASKSLAPGLRLGWLVAEPPLLDEVLAAKETADRQSTSIEQLTLADFISSGRYDHQVRRMRLVYRRRRDRLVAALRRHHPQLPVSGIAAGLHAVLQLPPGVSEAEAERFADRRDLAVGRLGAFALTAAADRPPTLVVGYGSPPDHAFTGALARLCAVLDDCRAAPSLTRPMAGPAGSTASDHQLSMTLTDP